MNPADPTAPTLNEQAFQYGMNMTWGNITYSHRFAQWYVKNADRFTMAVGWNFYWTEIDDGVIVEGEGV